MTASAQAQPTVLSISPTNGAVNVPGTAPVVFTFSTAMNTTVTFAMIFDGLSLVRTQPAWNVDGTRLTNTPVQPFPSGKTINWMVSGLSAAGQFLAGTTTGSFTVGSGGPSILSVVPAPGTSGVSLSAPVVFTFSTNMNMAATSVQFINASVPPPNTLTVAASWNTDGTRLTHTPNPPFPANKAITWSVLGQDSHGRALSGMTSGGFLTGGGGGGTPVTLVSTLPADKAVNVPTNASVQFTFSAAMDINSTVAQFTESSAPAQPLGMNRSWSANKTVLTCTPAPPFPTGEVIIWNVQGQGSKGEFFAGAGGGFTIAGSPSNQPNQTFSALLSRGEIAEQVATDLLQTVSQEFSALAGKLDSFGLEIATPALVTNVLSANGAPPELEFTGSDPLPLSFATSYPAGTYQFLVTTTGGVSSASLSLSDGIFPSAPRLINWQNPPRTVLGQPLTLQWSLDGGGAAVSYLRMQIEQNGRVVFATPLPDSPGALNAASNTVVVPSDVLNNTALAEVRLTSFSFTALETNSIPGVTLHAARHRTTTFKLRVVDGATPPPTLRSKNLAGFAVGEPMLFMLRTTNGARPIQFTMIGGGLPPGLMLDPQGALVGQASRAGTFDATLRLTDLLGQSTTQSLRVTTAVLPLIATPRLESVVRGAGSTVQFDMVGGAGADCVIERSTNLVNWTSFITINSPLNRVTLPAPLSGDAAYFRARGLNESRRQPNPRTVAPVLNTNVTATAELNWPGGSLSLTNASGYVFTLNVPPGALRRAEMIAMTEIAQVQGLPLSGGLRAAVDLKPEGLTFQKPARLDITAPTALDPKTSIAFGALADGSQFALRPSFITNSTVSQLLRHFSSAGVGNGTSTDAQDQSQGFPPDDPNNAAQQDAAATIQGCRADPNCDVNSEETKAKLAEIYVRIADQSILPALKAASGGASDDALDQALFKWREWAEQINVLGLVSDLDGGIAPGELANRMRRATALASDGIVNGMTRACDQCRQHDLERMARVFSLAQMGELLGFGSESHWVECVNKCLVYKLKIEAEITVTTSEGKLRTKTKSEPKLSLANDSGEKFGESFTGSGSWSIEEVETVESSCPSTTAPASGTARIPTVLVDLFKERTITVPGIGSFVIYEYDPTLWVALGAELGGTPAETWTLRCKDVPPRVIDRVFGPAFLAMHSNETGSDQTGSKVYWLRDFDVGSGEKLFTKDYEREQATSKGPVNEKTHIELRHTPK